VGKLLSLVKDSKTASRRRELNRCLLNAVKGLPSAELVFHNAVLFSQSIVISMNAEFYFNYIIYSVVFYYDFLFYKWTTPARILSPSVLVIFL
jgi:hypothetical protein